MQSNQIYAVYGQEGRQMTLDVLRAADVAALIPKRDADIVIKPNLVVARPAEGGATTHVSVIEGIIDYLKENGFTRISIIESSWVGDNTQRAYELCGYNELSRRTGVPLYDLKRDDAVTYEVKGMKLSVCKRAAQADFLINVPVLKAHCQTYFTCALKNLKGIIPDKEKRRYHTLGIHKPVALLNAAIRPGVTVVDALCGDLTFEEGGNPVPMQRVLVGTDSVLLDSYGAELIGLSPDEVDYIPMAEQLGVGKRFQGPEQLIEINTPPDTQKSFPLSRRASMLARNVKADQACSACFGSLIHALNRLDEMGMLSRIRQPICIGQGYQDQPVPGLGIGRCCRNAESCVGGCPPSARAIVDFLMEHTR